MPTDVAAPLPDLKVNEGTTYTVTCDDASAIITELVVHGDQTGGPELTSPQDLTIYLQQSDSGLIRLEPIPGRGD